MTLSPPLRDWPRYPMSTLVGVAAIGVTLLWWKAGHMDMLVGGRAPVGQQPWTLVTSILPHANVVHLAFNLYWWWYFATRAEACWGPAKLLGVTLLLAVVSSAADVALAHGGVGLSGVAYGLLTMIYVLQRTDERFAGTIAQQTAMAFVYWFFLCIALTLANIWQVGNVAHGAGALAGWLIGLAVVASGRTRWRWIVCVATFGVATLAGATVARPWVNVAYLQHHDAIDGLDALQRKDYAAAATHYEAALRKAPQDAASHAGLGCAYHGLERHDDAVEHYKLGVKLDPSLRAQYGPTIASILAWQAHQAMEANDFDRAQALVREAGTWDQTCGTAWRIRGELHLKHGEPEEAIAAFEKARASLAENEYSRESHRDDLSRARTQGKH